MYGKTNCNLFVQTTLQANGKALTYIAKAIPEFIKELGVFM